MLGASYPADAPQTGDPTAVSSSAATVAGVVTPQGARATAFFEFGPTTAYGSRTAPMDVVGDGPPRRISADLTDLPAGTTIHYRLVTSTDLIQEVGADTALVTADAPPPSPAQDPPPVPPSPPMPPVLGPPPASPPAPLPAATARARLPLRVQIGNGAVRVQIAVDAAADITPHGTLTGKVKGRTLTLRLGTAHAHYAHGGDKTLTIKLSAQAGARSEAGAPRGSPWSPTRRRRAAGPPRAGSPASAADGERGSGAGRHGCRQGLRCRVRAPV